MNPWSALRSLRPFIVLALAVFLLGFSFVRSASLLEVRDSLERADAILVLGGDSLFLRTVQAVSLYHQGYARYLLLTGCAQADGLYNQDNPYVLKRAAMAMGIPPEAILLVTESLDTYSDLASARKIIARDRFKKIILITSPYHQRRAYLLARKQLVDLGVKILNYPALDPSWTPARWWEKEEMRKIVGNEYKKIVGSWLLGWIGPLPNLSPPLTSCAGYRNQSS